MQAYAALLTATTAIKQANSTQPTAIRDALKAIDLPETPFGPIKFDAHGQNPHQVLMTQVLDGQYRVVYPPEAAEAKPVVPTPPWDKR
jgi:branched-chain amino acid transport system substrate-binding protein